MNYWVEYSVRRERAIHNKETTEMSSLSAQRAEKSTYERVAFESLQPPRAS